VSALFHPFFQNHAIETIIENVVITDEYAQF
jgi:hypothetical protein